VLLNAEIGDAGIVDHRACGCRFDDLGYTQHVHAIRSVRKLTGDGVTFHEADIVMALDALAHRYGGGPADYQILEEQSAEGLPRYALVISPRVGILNESAAVEYFLAQLGGLRPINRFMANQWAQLGVVEVLRQDPVVGLRGKVLPYQTLRRA
jgi:hypothetical protein